MANYYVDSVGGNDSRNGTATNRAWKTLAKLNNVVFSAGDVIHLKRGSSWDVSSTMGSTGLRLVGNGTSGNPITLTAYDVGAAPEIKNTNASTYTRTITTGYEWSNQGTSGHYWVIENIRVTAGKETGFLVLSNYCTIRDCEITNCGTGIMTGEDWGGSNLYTNNYIHDLIMTVNNGSSDYGAVGMWPRRGDEISYNLFYKCLAPSLAYGTDGGMVELYGECPDVHIHHNVGILCDGILEMGGYGGASDTVEGLRVHDNVTIDCGCITLHTPASSFETTLDDIVIEHNTFVETSPEDAGYEHWRFIEWSKAAGSWNPTAGMLTFRNNIVVLTRYNRAGGAHWGTPWVSNKTGFTHTHNLFMRYAKNGATQPSLGDYVPHASEIYWQDPLFVSTSDLNDPDYLDKHSLQLAAGSPGLDAGTNLGYGADMLGVVRPVAGAVDIGAYQHEADEPEAYEGDAATGASAATGAQGRKRGRGSVSAGLYIAAPSSAGRKRGVSRPATGTDAAVAGVTGRKRACSGIQAEMGAAAAGAGRKGASGGTIGLVGARPDASGRKGSSWTVGDALLVALAGVGRRWTAGDAELGVAVWPDADGRRAGFVDTPFALEAVTLAAGRKRGAGTAETSAVGAVTQTWLTGRFTEIDVEAIAGMVAASVRVVTGHAALDADADARGAGARGARGAASTDATHAAEAAASRGSRGGAALDADAVTGADGVHGVLGYAAADAFDTSSAAGLRHALATAHMGLDWAASVASARQAFGGTSLGAVANVAAAMAHEGEAVVGLALVAGAVSAGLRSAHDGAALDALLELALGVSRGARDGMADGLAVGLGVVSSAGRLGRVSDALLADADAGGTKHASVGGAVTSAGIVRARGFNPLAPRHPAGGVSGLSGLTGAHVVDEGAA